MREPNIEGMVSDIQRFSLHDGPGIRTTVFMKGCSMRCFWCHNPETWSKSAQMRFMENRCTGCGACVSRCPEKALRLTDEGPRVDRARCAECGLCAHACIAGARTLCGKRYTPDELAAELRKDLPYYKNTGGGVTFSGGEPLLQADFLCATAALLKDAGISIAMETALNCDAEAVRAVLPFMDYVIADIKLLNEEKHRRATGVGLNRILPNFELVRQSGKKLLVRTPVIPGVNDDEHSIVEIARFIAGSPTLDGYELMPYHRYGAAKFGELGIEEQSISLSTDGLYDKCLALAESARACGLETVMVAKN